MDLTNREAFFEAENRIEKAKVKISDSELYTILIKANKFSSYTEIITNFDKNLAEPQYFFKIYLSLHLFVLNFVSLIFQILLVFLFSIYTLFL